MREFDDQPAPEPTVEPPRGLPTPAPHASFILPQRPPRVWTVFVHFVLTFACAILASSASLAALIAYQHGSAALNNVQVWMDTAVSTVGFNLSLVVTEAVLLVSSVLAAYCSPVPTIQRLRIGPSRCSLVDYVVMLIGMLAVSNLLDAGLALSGIDPGPALKAVGEIITRSKGPALVALILITGFGAGFGEEFLCRGYIQTRLSERWGAVAGVIVSSILFGILHCDLVHSPLAFIMGLYLGYITERTGSIRPAIFCHIINNMVHVWLAARLPAGISTQGYQTLLLSALVVGALATVYIHLRTRRQTPREP